MVNPPSTFVPTRPVSRCAVAIAPAEQQSDPERGGERQDHAEAHARLTQLRLVGVLGGVPGLEVDQLHMDDEPDREESRRRDQHGDPVDSRDLHRRLPRN